jgi:hypothetical protein
MKCAHDDLPSGLTAFFLLSSVEFVAILELGLDVECEGFWCSNRVATAADMTMTIPNRWNDQGGELPDSDRPEGRRLNRLSFCLLGYLARSGATGPDERTPMMSMDGNGGVSRTKKYGAYASSSRSLATATTTQDTQDGDGMENERWRAIAIATAIPDAQLALEV